MFIPIAAITLYLQLWSFNEALRFYDQLEVVPIYQSSIIINGILCGALLLDEVRFYSFNSIIMIGMGTLTSIAGILLTLKKHHTKTECTINM